MWCEDSKSGYEFWKRVFETLYKDYTVESKKNNSELCKAVIRNANGKLFVIDNADLLLDDGMRRHIALDAENQYIIIGRNPSELMLSQDEILEMDSESKDGITTFMLAPT